MYNTRSQMSWMDVNVSEKMLLSQELYIFSVIVEMTECILKQFLEETF